MRGDLWQHCSCAAAAAAQEKPVAMVLFLWYVAGAFSWTQEFSSVVLSAKALVRLLAPLGPPSDHPLSQRSPSLHLAVCFWFGFRFRLVFGSFLVRFGSGKQGQDVCQAVRGKHPLEDQRG